MPIDASEALKFIGVDPEKVENLDAFKAEFETNWAKAADISATQGRINGAFRTALKRSVRELGIEFDADTIEKADKPAEVLDQIAAKVKEHYTGEIAKLSEAAKGKGSEKIKEEYEAKLAQIAKDAEVFKADAQKWQSEFTNLNTAIAKQREEAEVNSLYEKAMASVKFREMTPLERQGFEVYVKSNYKPVKEGDAYAWVGPDGNKIKDEKRAASFKGIEQLVAEAAEQHKLIAVNPHAGKPIHKPTQPVDQPKPSENGTRKRLINPLAQ